jgi:hypothetical protein
MTLALDRGMQTLRGTGHRAAFDLRSHDAIAARAPVDVTCISIAIDGRARPYLEREIAAVADLEALDRLRGAAALLRRVRAAWLGSRVTLRSGLGGGEAEALFEGCRDEAPLETPAIAIRATLTIASRVELVLPPVLTDEDARSALEAIENISVAPTEILEMDLVLAPLSIADARVMIERAPRQEQAFCPQCAVPLPPSLDRCPECAAVLSTWREN